MRSLDCFKWRTSFQTRDFIRTVISFIGAVQEQILVVAFLALQATDISNSYTVSCTGFDLVVVFLVNAIEFVSFAFIVVELNFCFAVTVHAPSHA